MGESLSHAHVGVIRHGVLPECKGGCRLQCSFAFSYSAFKQYLVSPLSESLQTVGPQSSFDHRI